MLLKKDEYNTKIKDIEDKIANITNLTTNTTINAKLNQVKNEIPSVTNLARAAALNAKINEVKNKMPNINNLDTSTALTTVESKTPDHSKHITIPEFLVSSRNFCCKISTGKFSNQKGYCYFCKENRL